MARYGKKSSEYSLTSSVADEVWTMVALGLPELQELDCSWVFGMTDEKITLLFHHCSELRKLTIDGHKQITTGIFRKMIVTLPVLIVSIFMVSIFIVET